MNFQHLQASFEFAKDERIKMEEAIKKATADAIRAFESATGITVEAIDIELMDVTGLGQEQTMVSKVKASLLITQLR